VKTISEYFLQKKHTILVIALLTLSSQILGCAYGKIRHSNIEITKIHGFIDQNYDNFYAAYSGKMDRPGAIRFDLKEDDVILTGNGWHPIESRAQLREMLRYMEAKYRFWEGIFRGPYLYLILDKNDKAIGYYYSILDNTPVSPDGANYSLDPVTELDIRKQLRYPSIRGAGG
jgi:hypothetical protein